MGLPLALDPASLSASSTEPAFLARPPGAPVYHGFRPLDDVTYDGFTLGMITNWRTEPTNSGDAFLIAPDNSRAGLVWEVTDEFEVAEILPFEPSRWGVWNVSLPEPMTDPDSELRNLRLIVEALRPKWEDWRRETPPGFVEETAPRT